jgi:hypothetical protein
MNDNHRTVSWQGWRLEMPRRWDPVKLEGDHSQGYALFADAVRPRLGLRWQTPRKKVERNKAAQLAMKQEIGQLAADEAVPCAVVGTDWQSPLLYTEPQPPGRDVFSAYSNISGRLLQVAYHAHRREHIFAQSILPTLVDLPTDRAMPWSVFDLNCVIPAGMTLKSHRLNAGDLGLTFADRFNQITVRQIAVARLALQRLSLDGWITDQQQIHKRYHKPSGIFVDETITIAGQDHAARQGRTHRRRRFLLLRSQPRGYTTFAAHDENRDRLIILDGTDESLLRVIAATVGSI